MRMNLQEISSKLEPLLSILKIRWLPKRNADTWEERFSFLLVRLYAILLPPALLVTLLAPILLLSLVLMHAVVGVQRQGVRGEIFRLLRSDHIDDRADQGSEVATARRPSDL